MQNKHQMKLGQIFIAALQTWSDKDQVRNADRVKQGEIRESKNIQPLGIKIAKLNSLSWLSIKKLLLEA